MIIHHDIRIAALSVLISIIVAYKAVDLIERLSEAHDYVWKNWLLPVAIVDTVGIWTMQYAGKLALRLPVPIKFDWLWVVFSFLTGIIGSAGALWILRRGVVGLRRALVSSLLMGGVAISGLYYVSMAAMRFPGRYQHSLPLAGVAVLLAIALSFISLTLKFTYPGEGSGFSRIVRYHGSAILHGLAAPAMYFTSMAAVTWTVSDISPNLTRAVNDWLPAMVGIMLSGMIVVMVVMLAPIINQVQKQGAYLAELFAQAPYALVLLNQDSQIVRVNNEFTSLFGYTSAEAHGEMLSSLVVPRESLEEAIQFDELVKRGQRVDSEGVRCRKDGRLVFVSIIHAPVMMRNGRYDRYVIYRDITARKHAEKRLREYEIVIEASKDLITVIDKNYHFTLANRAFLNVLFMEREQVIGQPISLVLDRNQYAHEIKGKLAESFQGQEAEHELMFDFPQLGARNLVITYHPIEISEGTTRVACIMRDVTEKRHAEEERELIFEELLNSHQQLKVFSKRLVKVEEAERKRLAREIHDDIGQSLTALMMGIGVARKRLPNSAQKVREILEETEILTQETLEKARLIMANLRPAVLAEMGLVPALSRIGEDAKKQTGVTFLLEVIGVKTRLPAQIELALFRITQEALANVRKHANANQVIVNLEKRANRIYLSIQDDGVGFVKQVISPYKYGDIVMDEGWVIPSGHYGLIGIQERVILLGGTVKLRSAPGRGTSLQVELPIS